MHPLPRGFALQVGIPEGPSPTLSGPDRVDRAFPSGTVEERAIAVGKLSQRCAPRHKTDVLNLHFAETNSPELGDLADFLLSHPDKPRSAGATVSTLGTGEAESVLIPRCFIHRDVSSSLVGAKERQVMRRCQRRKGCDGPTVRNTITLNDIHSTERYHPNSHVRLRTMCEHGRSEIGRRLE